MTIASRVRSSIAVIAAAVVVMIVGLPTAPASAAVGSMTADLELTQVAGKPGYVWVRVWGNVTMSRTEAQGLINSGHDVVIRLWGEDQFSDDLLGGLYTPTRWANHDGLRFALAHKTHISLLNEDWGEDELYAGVRLLYPNTQTLRSAETNRLFGSF